MKKEINEYLNLNHLIEGKKQIEKIEQDLLNFNKEFFQNQILSRDGVLDYLTEEDLKTYNVFGLSVKEFLDLAESEKDETGHGQYIIDRKNKTIHVYRYPSLPDFVENNLKYDINYEKNILIVTQTINFWSDNFYKSDLYAKNSRLSRLEVINNGIFNICKARQLEGKFRETVVDRYAAQLERAQGRKYIPLPAIMQNRVQSMSYIFDISNNTLIEIKKPDGKW